jgi:glyoxylase-like metal-dependent hydrolase (beta-lactamase superfamily II)
VTVDVDLLPAWMTWQCRPFPDANLMLLHGRAPALVDSGFVGHARETAAWVGAQAEQLALVVNTHWHSDHVGGNALLQAGGAGIAASTPDARAVARRDPGCCQAEYLDQPVAPYTVDMALDDEQVLRLGDTDWQIVATPGHTPGHLALWQPDERLLAVGDALSDYDVGWVNLALDGPDATATALASLHRLADLAARVLLPAHGPIPADPGAALATAVRRAQRLVDDPAGAVWYGVRRILAFAVMIRGGIPADTVEPYLHARAWLIDAARLLGTVPEQLAAELVDTMLRSGAVVLRDRHLHSAAEHTPVPANALRVPFPRAWPAAEPARPDVVEARTRPEGGETPGLPLRP